MLSSSLRRIATRGVALRGLSTEAPGFKSVKDMIIKLIVVDPSGARKQVNGYVGKTLYETLLMQNVDIGPMSNVGKPETKRSDTWYEPTFGEGPTSGYDHVILAGNGVDTAARVNYAEQENLEDYWEWDELFDGSRLASCVELTKEMDGMIVYVPPRVADNCP